jgi:DNA-binding transcriptional MerR regulator
MTQLTVKDLARQAGVSPHTVRYYDRVGLLPTPPRSPSGYRLYTPEGVERLRFIRGAKHLGLRLQDIAQLLEVMDRGQCPCGHTEALLRGRLAEIDEEIAGLARLRDELARLLETHPATTRPGTDPDTWWCRNDFTGRR